MEDADAVPDVPLLCRVVLMQEEIFASLDRLSPGRSAEVRHTHHGLPRATTAVVKELVPLATTEKRRAAIAQCAASSAHVDSVL